jgi:hypothetical protein
LEPISRIVDFKESACQIGSGRRAVQEKRTIFRKRVLKTAQIVLSEKAPKLDCSIRKSFRHRRMPSGIDDVWNPDELRDHYRGNASALSFSLEN